jgi:hypothetical protein
MISGSTESVCLCGSTLEYRYFDRWIGSNEQYHIEVYHGGKFLSTITIGIPDKVHSYGAAVVLVRRIIDSATAKELPCAESWRQVYEEMR